MDFGDLEQLKASFRPEAADLLADLGVSLLQLEQDPHNIEVVNSVFRAMHTLKGSGATAGFRRLVNFVHHVEEVFNRIRNRQLEATPELIDAALKACDCCAMLLELGDTDSDTPLPLETEVLAAIGPFLPEMEAAVSKNRGANATAGRPARYKIGFQPNREIFFSGTDPASLLLELTDLGTIAIRCEMGDLLSTEDYDPEKCYLGWEVSLETIQPDDAVRGIFQFVEEDCGVTIARAEPTAADRAKSKNKGKDDRFRGAAVQCFTALGYALEQCQSGDEKQGLGNAHRAAHTLLSVSKAHGHAQAVAAAEKLLDGIEAARQGGILDGGCLEKMQLLIGSARTTADSPTVDAPTVDLLTAVVSTPVPSKTEEASPAPDAAPGSAAPSIRVDSVKLDVLMRLAGELLVARGALPSFADRIEREEPPTNMAKEMRDAGAKVSRLADDLQATVMSIRMMPVRQVFQRFPRLVRDIARTLDKNIELHVTGEATELDKTVIDSIGDPLTHIIRNSADHGIESKADRAQQGKPAIGRIDLSAFTRGSNVVIEIKDDGKGLDAAKLKRRAVEKGLLSEAQVAVMDEQEAFKIIMAPGFSTVDQVTDLSGRGVGMDVVRLAVEAMRGVIHIKSELGKGTCLRIEFPASLLVSKGILVLIAGQRVVLPMETIRIMVKIPQETVKSIHGQQIALVRGAVFPLIALADALCFDSMEEKKERSELAVAIIDAASGSYGLVVDQFLGEVEVVIKPLNGVLAKVPEYVGAAIMANGNTVLVVNTERLFSLQRDAAIVK